MKSSSMAGRRLRVPRGLFLICFLMPSVPQQLLAKTVGLTVIELYPNDTGVSYEQISGFILNGKNEVALCGDSTQWDKSGYHRLPKVVLAPGMTLSRNSKGVLMLSQATGAPACVVPANLKLDKADSLTPSSLADKAAMEGTVLPASDPQQTQISPLKPGVEIVIVPTPNQELAEYLRADKASVIPVWEAFLKRWGSGTHGLAAKQALSKLYLASADSDLKDYAASRGKDPDYAKLKAARQFTDQALALVPDFKDALSLSDKVHREVVSLSKFAQDKLAFYRSAMEKRSIGYSNLPEAEKLAENALNVEPNTQEAVEAQKEVRQARNWFNQALKNTETMIAAGRLEEAEDAIKPVAGFATEVPKISDDLRQISALYVNRAKKSEEAGKWPDALADLTKADELVPSAVTQTLLADAKQKAHDAEVNATAEAARQKSVAFESSGDLIHAFEVLDDLPKESRDLVATRISELQDKYIKAAEDAAKNEKNAHFPIKGLADELGIQRAYEYWNRCYRLTNDPDVHDSILVLADELSRYYLQQGIKYAEKPGGIGSNVGWTYLNESLEYRSAINASAAHDELAKAQPAHQLKSKLSVKVDFRDTTSRRESAQFAEQLDETLASGLETVGPQVKVVRQDNPSLSANFQLIGDVLEHSKTPEIQNIPKPSKFKSGEIPVPNEAWTKVKREIDAINRRIETERSQLQGFEAAKKKKESLELQKTISNDSTSVDKLQAQLDSISQTRAQPVVDTYYYTEVVHNVTVSVDLQFHVLDSAGNEVISRQPIRKKTLHTYKEYRNVKAEDTEGVKDDAIIPDENKFFDEVENEARQELITDARKDLNDLPGIVLSIANRKAADGDSDGAAELYILYLNCTPVADTPERTKARKYLTDTFNFKDIGKTAPED